MGKWYNQYKLRNESLHFAGIHWISIIFLFCCQGCLLAELWISKPSCIPVSESLCLLFGSLGPMRFYLRPKGSQILSWFHSAVYSGSLFLTLVSRAPLVSALEPGWIFYGSAARHRWLCINIISHMKEYFKNKPLLLFVAICTDRRKGNGKTVSLTFMHLNPLLYL